MHASILKLQLDGARALVHDGESEIDAAPSEPSLHLAERIHAPANRSPLCWEIQVAALGGSMIDPAFMPCLSRGAFLQRYDMHLGPLLLATS